MHKFCAAETQLLDLDGFVLLNSLIHRHAEQFWLLQEVAERGGAACPASLEEFLTQRVVGD
ncbi:hypothetical protein BOX15_Mlig031512g1 [Macrostomum lignano]|uniref:Uncharacterized protein n=1 Tax=Macrostomum lignano TaxID=282301 RepID=A0A267ESQ0_9PLAT|nr:hypothetical protein BOX15_Mlig031512g1 [Macrostomum lignano]